MAGVQTQVSVLVHGSNAFSLIWVDDVHFTPPDVKVCESNGVRGVLVFLSINNGSCTKAPVDKAVNDPNGSFLTETTYIIEVSTGEELDVNHIIYGLVGAF